MSLYSANKLKSTLPPSGLKLILLDSGWFRSFPYASHNVNENQMEFGFNEPFQLFVFCRLILLFCDLSRVICSSTYYIHSEPLNDNEVPTRTNTIFSPSKCYFDKMKGTESWFPVPTQSTCLIDAYQYLDCYFCNGCTFSKGALFGIIEVLLLLLLSVVLAKKIHTQEENSVFQERERLLEGGH